MTRIHGSDAWVLARLRIFLLVASALACAGTMVELWLTEHVGSVLQLLPFVLCTLGIGAVVLVLARPQRRTIRLLRVIMGLVALGGLFGIFEHLEHNLEFAVEIQPNASTSELIVEGLMGANPLLAPGILAGLALLAIAATYYHPALHEASAPPQRSTPSPIGEF